MPRYWGYRIDVEHIAFFDKELTAGRLRQGWGWSREQDLRNMTLDEGAGRNRRMLEVVKGDILVIPRLSEWGRVTLARATADWVEGYKFDLPEGYQDFGHCFPAQRILEFTRKCGLVGSGLDTALHCRSRFWSLDHCAEDIARIQAASDEERLQDVGIPMQAEMTAAKVLSGTPRDHCMAAFNQQFAGAKWEHVLVDVFATLFPSYTVEHVGGKNEELHGADILIHIPGISQEEHLVAIQVKDHWGMVNKTVLDQLGKADGYWTEKLSEKILVVTQAKREDHSDLVKAAEERHIKIMFAEDVAELVFRYACSRIAGCA